MKNILVALNPSKDKDGKILSLVIEEITKVFKSSKITVLNSYEMSKYKFDNKLRFAYSFRGRRNFTWYS